MVARNDDFFAARRLLDELRQPRLRIGDVDVRRRPLTHMVILDDHLRVVKRPAHAYSPLSTTIGLIRSTRDAGIAAASAPATPTRPTAAASAAGSRPDRK